MPSDKPHNGVISQDLIHSILVDTTLTLEFVFAEVSTNFYCVSVILGLVGIFIFSYVGQQFKALRATRVTFPKVNLCFQRRIIRFTNPL